MTEYIEPDEVTELVDRLGFHWRDQGLMYSALAAPMPTFGYERWKDAHDKAAVLLRAFSRNHPLLDGNKRTAWILTGAFLRINGWDLTAPDAEAERFILETVTSTEEDDWAIVRASEWLTEHSTPIERKDQ